jgi:hypothetical protein
MVPPYRWRWASYCDPALGPCRCQRRRYLERDNGLPASKRMLLSLVIQQVIDHGSFLSPGLHVLSSTSQYQNWLGKDTQYVSQSLSTLTLQEVPKGNTEHY